jgi:hypothetical protein
MNYLEYRLYAEKIFYFGHETSQKQNIIFKLNFQETFFVPFFKMTNFYCLYIHN